MKILIVGPSWVGDAVISQSLLKVIIDRHESSTIDILSSSWTLDVYKRMEEVSKSLIFPFNHGDIKLRERVNFGKKLKVKSYDQVIVLPNSLKSALVPFFADIPQRTGWIGEMRYFLLNDIRKLNKKICPRMVDRFVALAFPKNHSSEKEIPFPHLIVDEKNLDKVLKKYQLRKDLPLLTLCPGAEFGPSKRWPAANFSKIADHFIANKWQILLLGSKNDISSSQEVIMGMANKEKKSTFNRRDNHRSRHFSDSGCTHSCIKAVSFGSGFRYTIRSFFMGKNGFFYLTLCTNFGIYNRHLYII